MSMRIRQIAICVGTNTILFHTQDLCLIRCSVDAIVILIENKRYETYPIFALNAFLRPVAILTSLRSACWGIVFGTHRYRDVDIIGSCANIYLVIVVIRYPLARACQPRQQREDCGLTDKLDGR